jgi:arsenite-transporting ATPase
MVPLPPQNLSFIKDSPPKIVMFTGKGGVGKTTASSATAVHFAENGYKTLLISTDPSPSLSDMFDLDVKGKITTIPSVENLYVVELDYELVVELWKEKYGDQVYQVASSFLPVEPDIIDYIAGVPGMDQEYALGYLYELHTSGDYDIIIWDTAPAGGTLALLNVQETFYKHLGEAAKLYLKIRATLDQLNRGAPKRDPLKMIAEWEQLSKNVLDMMRNPDTMGFVVTIPEALCVSQAKRVVTNLEKFGITIGGVVLNRVLTEEAADSEFNKQRIEVQKKYIKELEDVYEGELIIAHVPLLPYEVKGAEPLSVVGKILYE